MNISVVYLAIAFNARRRRDARLGDLTFFALARA